MDLLSSLQLNQSALRARWIETPRESRRVNPNGLRRVFGCWHRQLSLPFTRGTDTYRTCVSCGARRRFDVDQWTMVGDFYYPKNLVGERS